MPKSELAAQGISEALENLDAAETLGQLRLAEARAAAAYWSAWSRAPGAVRPPRRRLRSRRTGERSASAPRRSPAARGWRPTQLTPLLNYAYAVVESEASIAARVVGLDPGLGILHADQPNRDSLADDLMEPVRPLVDRFVLRLLAERRFAGADFHETRQGVCRITPRLAREVAEAAQALRPVVGAVAEDVARALDGASTAKASGIATPLSGRNRSAGRGADARRATHGESRSWPRPARPAAGRPPRAGGPALSRARRRRGSTVDRAFAAAARPRSRELRAAGWTPEMSAAGRRRIASRASSLVEAARAWQRENPWPDDMALFEREIGPRLADVPVRDLVEATGLSEAYCRRVKRGLVVPHPMWWERLTQSSAPKVLRRCLRMPMAETTMAPSSRGVAPMVRSSGRFAASRWASPGANWATIRGGTGLPPAHSLSGRRRERPRAGARRPRRPTDPPGPRAATPSQVRRGGGRGDPGLAPGLCLSGRRSRVVRHRLRGALGAPGSPVAGLPRLPTPVLASRVDVAALERGGGHSRPSSTPTGSPRLGRGSGDASAAPGRGAGRQSASSQGSTLRMASTSTNWSGYVAGPGPFTAASGTFTVPGLAATPTIAATSIWVGIDGVTQLPSFKRAFMTSTTRRRI